MRVSRVASSARSQDFESLTSLTAEALEMPEVRAKLGALATVLMGINHQAFLPNIRFGRLKAPKEYMDTDSIALVPLDPSERLRMFRMDKSLNTPTRQRMLKMRRQLGEYCRTDEHTNSIIELNLQDVSWRRRQICPLFRGGTMITRLGRKALLPHTQSEAYLSTRPVVFADTSILDEAPDNAPAMVAHEYVHAHDEEALDARDERPEFSAYTEIRAYSVSSALLPEAAAGSDVAYIAQRIEQHRRSLGVGMPQSPGEVPLELVQSVHELGAMR